ncbi:hypothetical protein FB451DRAFT_1180481 [Mycena latifolia]|nr:hypothetical protein FB451DRAFT_1180481 [Mycena latifolia]
MNSDVEAVQHCFGADWWDHKAISPWVLPCLIKSQSPMSAEDSDNTPATTYTNMGGVARELETSIKTGVLDKIQYDSYHRRSRNATRQSTAIRKTRESRELLEEAARLRLSVGDCPGLGLARDTK